MRFQQSDLIFNMGVEVLKSAFNFEPKYRVTTLTGEEWTKGSVASSAANGLVWFTDGSKTKEGTGDGFYEQSVGERLNSSLGRYVTIFQAEIYAILACVYEIQIQNRPEKYVCVCSDSQTVLKAIQAVRTTSPLVQQCQKALNDMSTRHVVGLCCISRHAGI